MLNYAAQNHVMNGIYLHIKLYCEVTKCKQPYHSKVGRTIGQQRQYVGSNYNMPMCSYVAN